ncbi:hypothetical protein BJV74DRAFT_494211 [Russula compacta]|nr:hypothetical protein BJV74DRAFT_494211 [Russula compacta]
MKCTCMSSSLFFFPPSLFFSNGTDQRPLPLFSSLPCERYYVNDALLARLANSSLFLFVPWGFMITSPQYTGSRCGPKTEGYAQTARFAQSFQVIQTRSKDLEEKRVCVCGMPSGATRSRDDDATRTVMMDRWDGIMMMDNVVLGCRGFLSPTPPDLCTVLTSDSVITRELGRPYVETCRPQIEPVYSEICDVSGKPESFIMTITRLSLRGRRRGTYSKVLLRRRERIPSRKRKCVAAGSWHQPPPRIFFFFFFWITGTSCARVCCTV